MEESAPMTLKEAFALLTTKHEFKPGDLVVWKEGMRNKKVPAYGVPAVVVGVNPGNVTGDHEEGGSPYYHEPLDLLLMLWNEGNWDIFHYDARRFEPYALASEVE